MVRELEVHRGGRALAIDLDLEGVQGRLVGLGGEAHGQARVHGREGALGCGEVRGQGVGGEVGRGREGGHLALQRRDGGGVGADVGGVGGVFRLGRISGEAVRTVASCPAEMPWSSITGGSVTPSSRMRPVSVEGKSDIYI